MLKRKLIDSLKVVSMMDSALDDIPERTLNEYQLSRDLDILELDKLQDKPTIFHCLPLKRNYSDTAQQGSMSALFRIFCNHVSRIDNFEGSLHWDTRGDEQKLMVDDDNWNTIGAEVIAEVAKVIIEASCRDGDHVPFSQPDTSSGERRIRSRWLHALKEESAARMEKTAKAIISK